MSGVFAMWAIAVLLLALIPALINMLLSRSNNSSLLSVQLIGSGGIALCTLLSVALEMDTSLDVALLFALLAASTSLVVTHKREDDA